MLKTRIIPCLDVKDGRVVKGINFVDMVDAGDPVEQAKTYSSAGADEICFLDISASLEKRKTTINMVSKTAENVFIPLTVGGGINSIQDIRNLLKAGADKISINTGAILDEKLCQYLYSESNKFVFMDSSTYEQIEIGSDIISENQSKFFIENDNMTLQFYEDSVVGLELPDNVTLKVEETEAVVKGQTAASSYKPAILTGGIKTSVPPFISTEDYIVISTNDSSYVEKAKK